jgi:DNA repair photolyase
VEKISRKGYDVLMKIKEIKAKSIITKSALTDYVINPYVGCPHGCLYCYARFMKRFTNHPEPWGHFVDVKINAPDLIPQKTDKYKNKSILMSSVTDPYHPIEIKYKLTRKILEKLISLQPQLEILTKSDLVLRDIDLIKKFKNCLVTFSLSFLDEKLRRQLEPLAVSAERRINALKKLHKAAIKTAVFISPIFPQITDWQKIINKTKNFTNEYWFENLNPYFSIRKNIYKFLKKNNPQLIKKYNQIWSGKSKYWDEEEKGIKQFCKTSKLICKIYFHHGQK